MKQDTSIELLTLLIKLGYIKVEELTPLIRKGVGEMMQVPEAEIFKKDA
jgi:hypothetical protein